jgi:ribonuclease Z
VTTSFVPRLVNPPDGDPGLYLRLAHVGGALLFDLGENAALSPRELLRVSHVFVSHTHMDHFVGFDRLLRLCLARERTLPLYGPPGLAANVAGKLAGYTWNLTEAYPLVLEVRELEPGRMRGTRFAARDAFRAVPLAEAPFTGVALEEPGLRVEAETLDHGIPCLAFAVQEPRRLNVRGGSLAELGLQPGRWLTRVKQAVREGLADAEELAVEDGPSPRRLPLGRLRERLLLEAPGQRVVYVTDVAFSAENQRRIVSLARGADIFFCEAVFLDADRAHATRRRHLTARQAGSLARQAGVRRLEVFHFSPRYEADPQALAREAEAAFRGALEPDRPDDPVPARGSAPAC